MIVGLTSTRTRMEQTYRRVNANVGSPTNRLNIHLGGYNRWRGHRSYKGWSTDGIKRYNALFKKVARDRQKYPDFATTYLAEKIEENAKTTSDNKDVATKATNDPPTLAKHELWNTIADSDNNEHDDATSTESAEDDDDDINNNQKQG